MKKLLETAFSTQSNPMLYNKDQRDKLVVAESELQSGGAARHSPAHKDMSMKDEESTLLDSITRQRLVKI
jgi:hypothetical protein